MLKILFISNSEILKISLKILDKNKTDSKFFCIYLWAKTSLLWDILIFNKRREEKSGKEIAENIKVRVSKQICFVIKYRKYNRFTYVKNTISNLLKVTFLGNIDSSVSLAQASLPVSRILLQWLLAFLNFTLDVQNLFCS